MQIHCQIRQIEDLDILAKRSILFLIPTQFSLPVNIQHNPNLLEMAMKECHPKGFESEASKGLRFPTGGFFI
jgi:hypothetical protein